MSPVRSLIAGLAVACASALLVADAARAERNACQPSIDLVKLSRPLARFSERILRNEEITILAIGSSSTWGTGASSAEFSYPNRLQAELHTLLPKLKIKVVNRGIGGEDARQMLSRLDRDLTGGPDLVLWQVGTNALLGEAGVESQAPLIRDGLKKIRAAGADAILIDPQYAPFVLRDPDARPMVAMLARLGEEAGVPVFRRFSLMQSWHETGHLAFADMLAPDLFHMNDWSYGCFARNLAAALIANVQSANAAAPAAIPAATASVQTPRDTAAVSGGN